MLTDRASFPGRWGEVGSLAQKPVNQLPQVTDTCDPKITLRETLF